LTSSTPDNIDIVLNELDALVNIDLKTRQPKEQLTSLNIVRVGTSGSLQADIPVDSFVMASHGLDLNGMLHFYQIDHISNPEIEDAFINFTNWDSKKARPIIINNSKALEKQFEGSNIFKGMTATAGGFYGPQGRVLRLPLFDADFSKINSYFRGLNSLEEYLKLFYNYHMRSCILWWNRGHGFVPHTDTDVPAPQIRLWGTNNPEHYVFNFCNGDQYVREENIERGRLYLCDTSIMHEAHSTAKNVYTFFFSLHPDSYDLVKEHLI